MSDFGRGLVKFVSVLCGGKSRGPLNHIEHLEPPYSSVGWAAKVPSAIVADVATLDGPVSPRILENARGEYAFNKPTIVCRDGFAGKSLRSKICFMVMSFSQLTVETVSFVVKPFRNAPIPGQGTRKIDA